MTLRLEDLVEGNDYHYTDISNIASRTFRIVHVNNPGLPSTHLRLLEVTRNGHFDPFTYTKDEFRRKFIPKMKSSDVGLFKVARIVAFARNSPGFSDAFNELLVKLEV